MKYIAFLATPLFFLFLTSEIFSESCDYSYNPSATSVQWTAYKFTEKTGVKGTFKKITVTGQKKSAASIEDSARGIRFEIDSSSIDSANPDRDSKISKTFFGNDKNANILKGNFKNIKDGTAELVLNWNGIQRIVPVKFRIKNKTELEVEISIDVASWKMNDKLTALNTLCSELHKGKDGKSQLWPTVDVIISSKFEEKCK